MITISSHPASKSIYESLESLFYSGSIFLSKHQHFSFVCGKADDENSKRALFLKYLKENSHTHQILPILAEKAVEEFLAHDVPTHPDLGKFEELIAACVDSVLIFPESPGSFAELGYFAATKNIKDKALIANTHQTNSFINAGIIPLYNSSSSPYKSALVIGEDSDKDNKTVLDRLLVTKSTQKYRARFSIDNFRNLPEKHKMILIYELIRVLGFITEKNLYETIHQVFKGYEIENVKRLLAILMAMNYVNRNENGDYFSVKSAPALLEYEKDKFEKTKIGIVGFYQTHCPEIIKLIEDIE